MLKFLLAFLCAVALNAEELVDYEFKDFRSEDADITQNIIDRISLHEESYLLPVYYSFRTPPFPRDSVNGALNPLEVKLQFSFKTLLWRDIFADIGLFFAYTQTSFFQLYAPRLSSPFRDNDFMPELIAYRPLDVRFGGGKLSNIRFGYNHISNGEGIDANGMYKSRGIDRIFAELNYKFEHQNHNLDIALKAWFFVRKDPKEIDGYLGYSALKISYDLYKKHHFILNIGNLFHNYKKYRGSVRFEYKYDFDRIALYLQYFYGYGDNIFYHNVLSHNLGIGIALVRF